jgi:hypothetical protein
VLEASEPRLRGDLRIEKKTSRQSNRPYSTRIKRNSNKTKVEYKETRLLEPVAQERLEVFASQAEQRRGRGVPVNKKTRRQSNRQYEN